MVETFFCPILVQIAYHTLSLRREEVCQEPSFDKGALVSGVVTALYGAETVLAHLFAFLRIRHYTHPCLYLIAERQRIALSEESAGRSFAHGFVFRHLFAEVAVGYHRHAVRQAFVWR